MKLNSELYLKSEFVLVKCNSVYNRLDVKQQMFNSSGFLLFFRNKNFHFTGL